MNFEEHAKCYLRLIRKSEIVLLMKMDIYNTLVDRYNLMSVFMYFYRAGFGAEEYTVRNFHLALFLNHEVYEDVKVYKLKVLKHCLGKKFKKTKYVKRFLDDRFKLFQRMNFNTIVQEKLCQNLFRLIPSKAWSRKRRHVHCGVIRSNENII